MLVALPEVTAGTRITETIVASPDQASLAGRGRNLALLPMEPGAGWVFGHPIVSEARVTRGARYRLLAVVYASQFVPLAFFLYGLSAVLREREVALERIAFVQLLGLVWVVKFTWAPLVDRYGSRRLGHYRGWLLAVQTLLTVAVLALVPVDVVSDLRLLVGGGAAIALLSATHDMAICAAAVRLLGPSERGVATVSSGPAATSA
jgi:hypothetical protein